MKRLLIVVDVQVSFMKDLSAQGHAHAFETYCASRIVDYREAGDRIFFLLDRHETSYADTKNKRLFSMKDLQESGNDSDLYGCIATLKEDSDEVFYKEAPGSSVLFSRLAKAQSVATSMGVQPFQSVELIGSSPVRSLLSNVIIAQSALPSVPVIMNISHTGISQASKCSLFEVGRNLNFRIIDKQDGK